jgi:hypothetical protein
MDKDKRNQHVELLRTLEEAEAQARAIVEATGNCRPLLNRIRECVRETQERISAYKKAEAPAKTKPAPTPTLTPGPSPRGRGEKATPAAAAAANNNFGEAGLPQNPK